VAVNGNICILGLISVSHLVCTKLEWVYQLQQSRRSRRQSLLLNKWARHSVHKHVPPNVQYLRVPTATSASHSGASRGWSLHFPQYKRPPLSPHLQLLTFKPRNKLHDLNNKHKDYKTPALQVREMATGQPNMVVSA
jgi:hypothetical protein